jgi:hypothetical protein
MIYVIATIEVVAGKREQFLEEFRRLVPEVLAEQGCLFYGPTIDTPPARPHRRASYDAVSRTGERHCGQYRATNPGSAIN